MGDDPIKMPCLAKSCIMGIVNLVAVMFITQYVMHGFLEGSSNGWCV